MGNSKVSYLLAVAFLCVIWVVVLGFFYETIRVQQAEGIPESGLAFFLGFLNNTKLFFAVVGLLGIRGILFFSRMVLDIMNIGKYPFPNEFQNT